MKRTTTPTLGGRGGSVDDQQEEDDDEEEEREVEVDAHDHKNGLYHHRHPVVRWFLKAYAAWNVRSSLWSTFIVVGIIASWSISAVVTSNLTSEYENPWFLTWVSIAWGVIAAPVYWVFSRKNLTIALHETTGLTVWKAFLYSIPLSFGLALQALLYYIALNLTYPSTVVVLWNCSSVFVYVLSIFLLKEKVSMMKIASMSICIAGISIFSLLGHEDDTKQDLTAKEQLLGYILTFASAFVYALYSVLMKKTVGDCDLVTGHIFTSLQGAAVWLFLPLFPMAYYAGWIELGLPPSKYAWEMYSLAVALSCLMNYFFLLGITTISPLFVSVAVILTIPATALVSGDHFNASNVIGSVMVAAGFLGLSLDDPTWCKMDYWRKIRSRQSKNKKNSTNESLVLVTSENDTNDYEATTPTT